VKGDSDEKIIKLYPFAGRSIDLLLEPSQMSIDEFNEPHEGIQYSVNQDGTAAVSPDQLSIDDVPEDEEVNKADLLN